MHRTLKKRWKTTALTVRLRNNHLHITGITARDCGMGCSPLPAVSMQRGTVNDQIKYLCYVSIDITSDVV